MSSFGDAYKAIESVILLRSRVEGLERALDKLIDDVKQDGRDLLDHEKRLIRIETMIEMSGRAPLPQPRIER
jgi:hypothetical protein